MSYPCKPLSVIFYRNSWNGEGYQFEKQDPNKQQVYILIDSQMDGQMYGWMKKLKDLSMDLYIDRWFGSSMDGQIDEWIYR